jgi:uncharacterized membrane protein (UPF0127 family)
MWKIQRQVFVYNKSRETFLAFRVKIADSIFGRLVGLLGRRSLQPDSGVWIVPANAVHTIGMMFSFDLVLIDKDFRVVGLRELVRPFTITMPHRKAESVLELPAHTIFRSRTQIGDQLVIERYEAKKAVPAVPVAAEKADGHALPELKQPVATSQKPQFPVGPLVQRSATAVPVPPKSITSEPSRSRVASTKLH